jgi:hypothetical protein
VLNYHGKEKVEREKSLRGARGSGLGKAIGNRHKGNRHKGRRHKGRRHKGRRHKGRRHKGTEGIADYGMRIKKT